MTKLIKRLGRPPKHFAYTALRTPKRLDDNLKDLPEPIRQVAKKRHLLIAGLSQELGGLGSISVSEALLIDRVSRLWAYLEIVDVSSLETGKDRPLDYLGISNSLVRAAKVLNEIAAQKREGGTGDVLDLRQYLTQRSEKTDRPSDTPPEGRTKVPENDADSGSNVREVSDLGSETREA
jgi:hypothetical protein